MKQAKTAILFNSFVILLLASVAVIFYLEKDIDYRAQQIRIEKIRLIQQEISDLIRNTQLIERGKSSHFDYLAENERRVDKFLSNFDHNNSEMLQYILAIKNTKEVVSQIKSTFAVYHNSLLFFPKGMSLVRQELSSADFQTTLIKLDELERSVILYNTVSSNKQSRSLLLLKIKSLRNELSSLPNKLQASLEQLLTHTKVLIDYSSKLDDLNTQLLTSRISQSSQELIDRYRYEFKAEVKSANLARDRFYAILLVIILFIVYRWWKYQSKILRELRSSTEKLKLFGRVFKDTHDGIIITDALGVITDVNPAVCRLTGYSRNEIIGKNPSILSSGKQSSEFYRKMWQTIEEQDHWQGEVWNRKKDGNLYAELLTISALKSDTGKLLYYVGLFSDITTSKLHQQSLEQKAHYDLLTQLPNRALFVDRFQLAIAHSNRSKTLLAVCFLDLDGFKPINDNFGHEVGDQLLIEVANRLTRQVRREDTVSRQGGDEFTLLLGNLESHEQCEQSLERIQKAITQPYQINDQVHSVSASIGVTLYPLDKGDIDTLLRHADQAMYQAKQSGRNQFNIVQNNKVND